MIAFRRLFLNDQRSRVPITLYSPCLSSSACIYTSSFIAFGTRFVFMSFCSCKNIHVKPRPERLFGVKRGTYEPFRSAKPVVTCRRTDTACKPVTRTAGASQRKAVAGE